MHIDLDVEPSRPAPDREVERAREIERREYDAREPRREFSDRVAGVVRDVAAFRTVALTDLIKQQFDGHSYVARHGIAEAERAGWIERRQAEGPKGGRFTVVSGRRSIAAPASGAKPRRPRPRHRLRSPSGLPPSVPTPPLALPASTDPWFPPPWTSDSPLIRVQENRGRFSTC